MKNTCLMVIWLMCSSPAITFGQENMTSEQKEVYGTLVLIANSWSQNNLDSLEKYLDKGYVHTDTRGQFLSRSQWLGYIKDRKEKGVINSAVGFEDVHIEIYGHFAFVTGINTFSGAAYSGKNNNTQAGKIRFTQVLVKEDAIWKRKLFQATNMEVQ